jgi:hypothetical protein
LACACAPVRVAHPVEEVVLDSREMADQALDVEVPDRGPVPVLGVERSQQRVE